MKYLIFSFFALYVIEANSQNYKELLVISIEIERNKGLHKFRNDYWVVSINSWTKPNERSLYPLNLYGFSATDLDECCIDKELILFNPTTLESFEFEEGFLQSQNNLISLIKEKRKIIQTINKKWKSGIREKITVYITPVNGIFCICEVKHKNEHVDIGYEGEILMPLSDFEYNPTFLKSDLYKNIIKYDFSELPFLSLHTMH